MFATYLPPLSTLSGAANIPAASRSMRVPEDVLTDAVMEDIKARCCFVGEAFDADANTSLVQFDDDATETDVPPSVVLCRSVPLKPRPVDTSFSH